MKIKSLALIVTSLVIGAFTVHAQNSRNFNKEIKESFWHIGGNLGFVNYFGDMDSGNLIKDITFVRPNVSLDVGYHHNRFLTTSLAFSLGSFKGDDARSEDSGRRSRNLNFYSPFQEIALMEEINVFGINLWEDRDGLVAYLKAGVAGYHFNPKTKDDQGNEVELQPLGTEGQGLEGYPEKYNLYRLSIPFGGGLRYKFNRQMSMSLELLSRYTAFDYIDDLATNYVSKEQLIQRDGIEGAQKAIELSDRRTTPEYKGKRGEKDDPDYIFSYMLSFRYNLLDRKRIKEVKFN